MSDAVVPIKNFLEIPYDKLEDLNTTANQKRDLAPFEDQEKEYRAYLEEETRIKAVTVCFSDIEGRFHMLDYDKKFLLSSSDNLTFDGSSIRGFTAQRESDLRLHIDWTSFYWLPSDLFGPGKVIIFGNILNREGKQYESDFRGLLQNYLAQLRQKEGLTVFASAEIEGFLLEGLNAEQRFEARSGFGLVTTGGYFHSLPKGPLRQFIDASAEAQRAMGFRNEKDHPEVAPSQFEMNFSYSEALRACDHIQLYKLVCRTAAYKMGMTACFLPKPLMGINGSGMHTNLSLAKKGKNIFYDKNGEEKLSLIAWDFISRVLNHAPEMCLVLNSSVNAYRRLDPKFEAPNQIKVSAIDRGSMIRIPVGNERTSRIEIRSVAPDANPYLLLYILVQAGLKGSNLPVSDKRDRVRLLPGTIYDAIKAFKQSDFMRKILGEVNTEKYVSFKQEVADRSPKELGNRIKTSEIIYHHEVSNQALWNTF